MIPQLRDYLPSPIEELWALDLGSGLCKSAISCQLLELPFAFLMHLDIYSPDLLKLSRKRHVAKLVNFRRWDLRRELPYIDDSYDVVLGIDVLEHLAYSEGLVLLKEAERVASQRVLLFVPLGPVPALLGDQEKGNPHQEHRAIWWKEDLLDCGYEVGLLPRFHQLVTGTFDACMAWKDVS